MLYEVITRHADGDGAAIHRLQPHRDLLGGKDALAGDDRIFDAGQFADEAPAGGDQQGVVSEFAGIRDHPPAAVEHGGDGGLRITSYNVCYTKLLRRSPRPWRPCAGSGATGTDHAGVAPASAAGDAA